MTTVRNGDTVLHRIADGVYELAIVVNAAAGTIRTIAAQDGDDYPYGPNAGWAQSVTPVPFAPTAVVGGAQPVGIGYEAWKHSCLSDIPINFASFDQVYWQWQSDIRSLQFGELSRTGAQSRETVGLVVTPTVPLSLTLDITDNVTYGFGIEVRFLSLNGIYAPPAALLSNTHTSGTPGQRRLVTLNLSGLNAVNFPAQAAIVFTSQQGSAHTVTVHRAWFRVQ